ncbi:rhodanese-like domain-containing protein [soil metagenome]
MAQVTKIDRDELKVRIEESNGLVVVEALGPSYFEDAHLPGALNLPHDQVDEFAPQLLPDKDAEIVVYCSNLACQNSVQASRRLVELGYTRVFEYEDGKQDWIEAGLPVDSSIEQ